MKNPPNHHIPESMNSQDARLIEAASTYGTPLFYYSAEQIAADWLNLRRSLPEGVEIYYSVKANPSLAILDVLNGLGAGFEVSSVGELLALLRVGADLGRAVYVGPGKSAFELDAALAAGVGLVAVESPGEFHLLEMVASARSTRCGALLRINPGAGYGDLKMAGATQFGMDPATAISLLAECGDHPHVKVEGFHSFMGARLLDWHKLASNFESVLQAANSVASASGLSVETVDLGGGFGVPLYEGDGPLDLDSLGEVLGDQLGGFRRSNPSAKRFIVEVGRLLVARSGVFLTRVVDVKETAGIVFAVVDGGINAIGGRDVLIGGKAVPVRVLSKNPCREVELTVCGPLCTPADRIAVRVALPRPRPGDLVAVYNAGAYCLSASPGLLLSRGFPGEVMEGGGRMKLVRRPYGPEEMLAGQSRWSERELPWAARSREGAMGGSDAD